MEGVNCKIDQIKYHVSVQGIDMFGHLVEELKKNEINNLAYILLNHKDDIETLAEMYTGIYRNEFELELKFHCFSDEINPKKLKLHGIWLKSINDDCIAEFVLIQKDDSSEDSVPHEVGWMKVILTNDETDEGFKNDFERRLNDYYNLIKYADGMCDYYEC